MTGEHRSGLTRNTSGWLREFEVVNHHEEKDDPPINDVDDFAARDRPSERPNGSPVGSMTSISSS